MLWLLSKLFGLIVQIRNGLYDQKILKIHKVPYPVVSVGNLTVGGTGKTPLIDFLTGYAERKGYRVLIASRGYKSQNRGVSRVDPTLLDAPDRFGDEPVWLARRHPDVTVYVGADKVALAEWIAQKLKPDCLFLDDGFQHRRLYRDLDLLIIDASESDFNNLLLPLGRGREPMRNLSRADAIILTKTNLALPQQLESLERQILQHLTGALSPTNSIPSQTGVFRFPLELKSLMGIVSGKSRSLEELVKKRVILVSGIARPESFSRLIQRRTQAEIVDQMIFPDHHRFQAEDVQRMEQIRLNKEAEFIILTEKDAIKCSHFFENDRALVAKVALEPSGDMTRFYDLLDRIICKSC